MGDLPLSGPDDLEQQEYYYGLPSKPHLIARTSTASWPPPRPLTEPHGAHYDLATVWTRGALIKRLCPISRDSNGSEQHPILGAWSPALRNALVSALAESPLHDVWSAFYPIRVMARWSGAALSHDSTTSDVILLLCVAPDSHTTWTMGLSAAQSCRSVLQAYGVIGMEVEVCAAAVLPLVDKDPDDAATTLEDVAAQQPSATITSITSLDNFEDLSFGDLDIPSRAINRLAPFLSRPGQLVERMEVGPGGSLITAGTGTLGFYLTLGGDQTDRHDPLDKPAPIFAITSRHVALGRLVPHDATWNHKDAAAQPIYVLRWGTQQDLEQAASVISRVGERARATAHISMDRFADDKAKLDRAVRGLAFADKYVPGVVHAMRNIAASTDSMCRSIGHVAYAGPHRRTARGAWSDWALVELNDVIAETVRGRPDRNGIYVRSALVNDYVDTAVEHGFLHSDDTPFERGKQGTLPFHHKPSSRTTEAPQWPRWVMKRGAKTGVTVGVTSEIEAVFRVPLDDGHFRVAFALIVLDFAGDLEEKNIFGPFSENGDSGSAVFDGEGRLVGMLDAGVGNKDEALLRHARRVTLMTPIDWLLEDIEAVTGRVPHVL